MILNLAYCLVFHIPSFEGCCVFLVPGSKNTISNPRYLFLKAAVRPAEMQNSSSADAIWLAAASVMFGLGESYLANKISEAFGDDKGALRRTPQYVELRKIKNMVSAGSKRASYVWRQGWAWTGTNPQPQTCLAPPWMWTWRPWELRRPRYVELLEMIKEHFGASCSSQSHTQSHLSIAGEMTETVSFK